MRKPGLGVGATLAGAFCLACAGEAGDQEPARARDARPIIIVDIDTLRADHLGCYGYERDTSPNLDAFARESLRFDWAFSQAANTPPSQTSILTGLYPSTHGMIEDDDRVPESITTLAEALAAHGWRTAAFVDGGYMSGKFGIGQGFELYEDEPGGTGLAGIGPRVARWVEEHAAETFLLLIHTYDVHAPYAPPEPYRSMFLEGLEPPTPGFVPDSETLEEIRLSVWSDEPLSLPHHDLAHAKALYDGEIRKVDAWFGRFLERLERLGLDERAIVVVLSDHGEEFQEHGSVLHAKLYSTVTRIPLLIRIPGWERPAVIPDVVESVDLMPTLLDLAGVPIPEGVQGRSLLPLMRGEEAGPRYAFGESPFFGQRRFVADGERRLFVAKENPVRELFGFRADPLELNDVSAEHAEEVERLARVLAEWEERVQRAAIQLVGSEGAEEVEPLPEEIREQLRALGYAR